MTQLSLTVFGGVSLAIDDGPAIKIPRSCHGLLALLALQSKPELDRAEASFKLWPDTTEKKARHNLASTIWRLKGADDRLSDAFAADISKTLGLTAETELVSDYSRLVEAFEGLQNEGELSDEARQKAKAVGKLVCADPLPGIDAEWADIERERLISLQAEFLSRLALDCEQADEVDDAIRFGEELVRRDPFREDVHRLLMRLHVRAGNRAKAIAQYRSCQGEISAALGVSPMPETVELYEDLVALPQRIRAPQTPELVRSYTGAIRSSARDVVMLGKRQQEKLMSLLDYADRIDQIEM